MQRRFTTLDVFTGERFTGNPLAVVQDSEGLDPRIMQAIAREFGLPETVFVFPAADPAHTARLRIFTPAAELPFAGHPTVGCAVLLGLSGNPEEPRDLILEEQIGVIRCRIIPRGNDIAHARFEVPVLPRKMGWEPDASAVAAALRIAPNDIDDARFKLEKWSAGIDMFMIPVNGSAVLAGVLPDISRWEDAFGKAGPRTAYIFCPQGAPPARTFRARMFAPLLGIHEDPATGSAAAAFAGVLTVHGGLGSGSHKIIIEQGHEMGRPSMIHLEMQVDRAQLIASSIAGDAVIVTQGTLSA
jgi:trans-2,3-dihydro-3-hydroxyanthranilate isomerase